VFAGISLPVSPVFYDVRNYVASLMDQTTLAEVAKRMPLSTRKFPPDSSAAKEFKNNC